MTFIARLQPTLRLFGATVLAAFAGACEDTQKTSAADQIVRGSPHKAAAATAPSTEPHVLARGQFLYLKHCAACHGADGGGLIGPNLCDDYFIHGSSFSEIEHVIREGVPQRGMVPMKHTLRKDDIHAVASYVYRLIGTTPAKPRSPEGSKAPAHLPPP